MVLQCPLCHGDPSFRLLGAKCTECGGSETVLAPWALREQQAATFFPPPPTEPTKAKTPEEERTDIDRPAQALSKAEPNQDPNLFAGILTFARCLGIVSGILSVNLLIQQGFEPALVAVFDSVLDGYETFMEGLFGPLEPHLERLLQSTGWNQDLQPHWKHVLVLMWLYFGTVTRVIMRFYTSQGERIKIAVLTVWGFLLALASSLGAGAVVLDDTLSNVLMAVFPIVGYMLYQLGWSGFLATLGTQESWWNRYRAAFWLYLGPRVVAVIIAAFVLISIVDVLPFWTPPSPGLAVLLGLTVVLAFYWLWTGLKGMLGWPRPQDWSAFDLLNKVRWWWQSWHKMANTKIGKEMLMVLGGAFLFLLLGGATWVGQ